MIETDAEYPTADRIAERQIAICEEMQALYPDREWPGPSAFDFDDAFRYSDEVLGEVEHPLPDHRGAEILQKRLRDVYSKAGFQPAII